MGGLFSRGEKQNPWIARGEQAFEKQQYADACSHYVRAAELEPQNLEVLVRLANLQRYAGKYADALETYIKITEADADNRDAWIERALLEGDAGKYADALSSLSHISLADDETQLKERRCDWLCRTKDYSKAADAVRELAESDPGNERYSAWYAELLINSGKYADAGKVYTALISSFPAHAAKYTTDAAFCAEICGDTETALSLYRTLGEDDATGWYRRAHLEELNGLFSDAASSYGMVLTHDGQDRLQISIRRIFALIWSGKTAQASAELEKFLSRNTQSASLWYMLGILSFLSGSMKRAAEAFTSCLHFSQNLPYVWNMKATAEFFSGQYKAASESFHRAEFLLSGKATSAPLFEDEDDMPLLTNANDTSGKITFADENPELSSIEACCLAALGRVEEADKAALSSLSADPSRVDMEILHLRLLAASGRYRETAELSARIEELAPGDSTILLQHAESEMLCGNFSKAADIFRKLIEEYPDNAMLHSRLMTCIINTGDGAGVKAAAEELFRVMPESAEAQYAAADASYASGAFREAAAGYEKALMLQPENVNAAVSLGKARMMLGEYASAKEMFSFAAAEIEENVGVAFYQAKCAAAAGNLEEAASLYASIVQSVPEFSSASGELVSLYSALGKYEEAEATAAAAVSENAADFLHYKLGGDACMNLSRYEEAVTYYTGALGLKEGDVAVTAALGQAYLRLGEYETALEVFSTALAEMPDSTQLLSSKALCELNLGMFPEAEETLRTETTVHPDNLSALLLLADTLEYQQKYDEVLDVFGVYLEHQPDNIEVIRKAASVYAMRGEYEEALGAYDRILGLRPDDQIILRQKAEALAALGLWDEAAEFCDTVISTSMDDADIRLLYAKVLTAAGRYEEAGQQYVAVLKADRTNIEALLGYGNLLSRAGNYKKAVIAYDRILRILPSNAFIGLEKAQAAYKLGDTDTLLSSMQEAVSANPDNPHLLSGLGYLAYLSGRPSDALSIFDKAEAAGNTDVDINCVRAQIYLGQSSFDQALYAASEAAEKSPGNAHAWHLKARALEGLGNLAEAVECYQQALAAENVPDDDIIPFLESVSEEPEEIPPEKEPENVRASRVSDERDFGLLEKKEPAKSAGAGTAAKRPPVKPVSRAAADYRQDQDEAPEKPVSHKKTSGHSSSFGDEEGRGKKPRGFIIN